jgi:hypothetical protein
MTFKMGRVVASAASKFEESSTGSISGLGEVLVVVCGFLPVLGRSG